MVISITVCALILLIILISWFKLNSFISFLIVAILAGLSLKIGIPQLFQSIEKGIGSTLGSIAAIIVLGAMLGKIIAESGAVESILNKMTGIFGTGNMRWAFMVTGFIVGIPLFYSVGFILLAPLVLTMSARTKIPPVYLGLPMLAALSVTQGYLPPHPGPMVILNELNADLGKTLLYGIVISVPAILVSGLWYGSFSKKVITIPNPAFVVNTHSDQTSPGTMISLLCVLSPVILISAGTICSNIFDKDNVLWPLFVFLQNPTGSLLLSLLMAGYFLAMKRGRSLAVIGKDLTKAVKDIANLLLIFAGAGALKQVLIDGDIQDAINNLMSGTIINPLISGWMMAAIIRVCVGSSTIASITTAAFILPLMSPAVDPNLMVLSIGAGSMMFSHVNDTGFWLFREYFQTSMWDTLRTWSIMETLVSITGLLMVLLLNYFI